MATPFAKATQPGELRSTSRNAKQIIATLEATERNRSGINNLRIRFNGVFGYFIEVSKANAARVPIEYERRQTLANAERFTTPSCATGKRKCSALKNASFSWRRSSSRTSAARSPPKQSAFK